MGILFSEVKYYKSIEIDFEDSTKNGGSNGEEIVNDTLHSIFPEISATQREEGLERYAKIFVSNESADRLMNDTIFYVKQDVQIPDRLRLFEATENEYIIFYINEDINGSSETVVAGTEIQIQVTDPSDYTATNLVGRKAFIGGIEMTVTDAPTDTSFTLDKDIDFDISSGTYFSTSDMFYFYESDEDFSTAKEYVNTVIMSTVSEGVTTVDIYKEEAENFEIGDSIIILDQYFRAVHRTTISDIQDDANDETMSLVTMSSEYASTQTMAVGQGFLANGPKMPLKPYRMKSLWLKLTVEPASAIDAEIINQFQLGVHFDDIEA